MLCHHLASLTLLIPLWFHIKPCAWLYMYTFVYPFVLLILTINTLYKNFILVQDAVTISNEESGHEDITKTNNPGSASIIDFTRQVQDEVSDSAINARRSGDFDASCPQLKYRVIKIELRLRRAIHIQEGQHIGLCIPTSKISKDSVMHIHPFMVTSWSSEKSTEIELFVDPQRGWTQDLALSLQGKSEYSSPAYFVGPFGRDISIGRYETVLLIASDFGIVSFLSYLRRAVHDYLKTSSSIKKVHLIWQLDVPGKEPTSFLSLSN